MRKMLILFVICFLLFNSTLAFADNKDPFFIPVDVALARPLGLASIVIGGAILIVCLPFALPSGSVKTTADALVGGPFRFTFRRPLGSFSDVTYTPAAELEKKTKE